MNFTQTQRSTQRSQSPSQHNTQRNRLSASQLPENVFSERSDSYAEEDGDLSKKADECVQYILFCCMSEKKAIVRRADLNKNIIKDFSRQYKSIIEMVKTRLEEVFGIELVELDNISDKAEKLGIRTKYEYDLELNKPIDSKIGNNENDLIFQEQFKYSMVMISLAIIFMNDNEIESGLFWDCLKRLDINKDEKKHKYLGDINRYFTVELVKEGFLEYETIKGIDPPTYKFKAGYRSKLEISKKSILEFVCAVYGGIEVCKPDEWSSQYADAMKEEGEEGGAEEVADVTMEAQQPQYVPLGTQNMQSQRNTQNMRPQRTQR